MKFLVAAPRENICRHDQKDLSTDDGNIFIPCIRLLYGKFLIVRSLKNNANLEIKEVDIDIMSPRKSICTRL